MTSFQPILPLQSQNAAYAHIIQSDAEALEIAKNLAEQFKHQAIQRDAERILPFEEILRKSKPIANLGSGRLLYRRNSEVQMFQAIRSRKLSH